ncbi:MAG TPA: membrane lipoprotein lipid attachment site-containing protein [Chitinophagaceae bacterium]|jgi:hypothetical protein|nr:membrane lipoprotein lipid attachment site-containing protein [Chitinophagaceae bacterium]
MKKILFGLLLVTVFAGCSNYGKKVPIEGTKGEILYKGDGVTERDAQKLGKFLKEQEYFDNVTAKSVQLLKTKDGDGYDLHFVVDEKKVKETEGVENTFRLIGATISENVFGGKPVNVFLSDEKLKDLVTILYDKKKAEELVAVPEEKKTEALDVKDWDHDKAGGVEFYWKGISDEESKTIADYIVQNGAFAGGTANIYMTKEGERFILRFPMIESARTDPAYIAEVGKVSQQIKDNVFANAPYSFYITDENMTTIKAFDY